MIRGNETEWDETKGEYVFSDTKESSAYTWKDKPCGHCGDHVIKDGNEEYDSCIGKLPGLMNACCGHGDTVGAYVQFMDGFIVDGKDAKTIQEILIRWRDKE